MKYFCVIIFMFTILTNSLFSQVPTNGLAAYWPFNGDANDSSGNGNNGTVNGATLTTDRFGRSGYAYSFTNPSWIDFGNILNEVFTTNTYSISVWYSQTVQAYGSTINKWYDVNASVNNAFWMGPFGFCTDTPSHSCTNLTLPPINKWTHDVAVLNNGTLNFYRNGTLVYTQTGYGSQSSDESLTIGINALHQSQYQYYGSIGDIRIYNRALSAAEVGALYHEGGYINLNDGLVAYYPFDGNAIDSSGNGNNGATNGGVTWVASRFSNGSQAIHFDGSSGYVEVPNSTTLQFTNQVAVSAWINFEVGVI